MPDDWFAKNAPKPPSAGGGDWFSQNAPEKLLSQNPRGEGTYSMQGLGGQTVGIPYSNVKKAQSTGFSFIGPNDAQRYAKDLAATPANQGPISSFLGSSGASGLLGLGHRVASSVIHHPLDSANTVLDAGKIMLTPKQPGYTNDSPNPIVRGLSQTVDSVIDNTSNNFHRGVVDYKKDGLSLQTRRDFGNAIPIVGPALQTAEAQTDAGNNSGALGTLLGMGAGLAAPELLEAAPGAASKLLGATGEYLQDSGTSRMARFLNKGKDLPIGEYNNPAGAVLDSGPGTSIATNRPSLTRKIAAARSAAGPAVSSAVNSSSARIPLADIRNAVDSTLDPMRQTASGPLGNPAMGSRFDQVRDSFGPTLDLNGTTSPSTVHDALQTMDKNINWNRSIDPIDATARNAGRQIRGKVSSVLKDAVPAVQAPMRRYSDLSDALDLSTDNQDFKDARYGSLPRTFLDAAVGAGTGALTHNPMLGVGAAAATNFAPMLWKSPLLQTGLATGAYQAGKLLNGVAPALDSMTPGLSSAINAGGPNVRLIAPIAGVSPQLSQPTLLKQPTNGSENEQNPGNSPYQNRQGTPPRLLSVPPAPSGSPITPPVSRPLGLPTSQLLRIPPVATPNALGLSDNAIAAITPLLKRYAA